MKKNNVMRVFALMLALTLVSVCAISGTFAKYVTRVSGEDAARVAKWGVLLTVEGNNFGTKYAAEDEAYLEAGGEYSVESYNGEDLVVAPGTSSDLIDAGMTATVKGTPEVAARYTISGVVDDIVLKAGTYTDYTELVKADDGTYGYTKEFTLEKDYSPVKWNLVISKGTTEFNVAEDLYTALSAYPDLLAKAEALGFGESGCSFFSAIEILKKVAGNDGYKNIVEAALGNVVHGGRNFQLDVTDDGVFTMSYDFDPNKEMDYTFELSWEWAFEQIITVDGEEVADPIVDAADTYLGNVAAGVITDDNANTTIGAELTAPAVQID
ncbi:MAG: hypothetical protein IKH09_00835 [Clostridia bacterium]|nr:hypothetical protein [Clostridia bacterium]